MLRSEIGRIILRYNVLHLVDYDSLCWISREIINKEIDIGKDLAVFDLIWKLGSIKLSAAVCVKLSVLSSFISFC